jgi:hypothetical protein
MIVDSSVAYRMKISTLNQKLKRNSLPCLPTLNYADYIDNATRVYWWHSAGSYS